MYISRQSNATLCTVLMPPILLRLHVPAESKSSTARCGLSSSPAAASSSSSSADQLAHDRISPLSQRPHLTAARHQNSRPQLSSDNTLTITPLSRITHHNRRHTQCTHATRHRRLILCTTTAAALTASLSKPLPRPVGLMF